MKIKKTLLNILSSICLGFAIFSMVACNENNSDNDISEKEHIHDWDEVERFSATCEKDGIIIYVCPECEETKEVVYVNALGHDYYIREHVDATCEEDGYTTYICSNNSIHSYTEIHEATGHKEVIDDAVKANCEETGLTEGKHCSECDKVLVSQEVVEATGHTYENENCIHCGYSIFSEGLTFELNKDEQSYKVADAFNLLTDKIIIPSTHKGKPVTVIGESAFIYSYVKNVIIPSSVLKIEDYAFYNSYIEKVSFSEGLVSIGERAFAQCHSLETIVLPDSLTTIKSFAFEHTPLKSIKINKNITDMGNCVFSYSGVIIYCEFDFAPNGWSGSWDDDREGYDTSKNVYWGVLYTNIDDVEYVIVDKEARVTKYIGDYKHVVIQDNVEINGKVYNVTNIGKSAFTNCETLISIEIPDSVKKIDSGAFYECLNLRKIKISEDSKLEIIEAQAFVNCFSLTSIVIPKNVTTVGNKAFEGCFRLVEVYNLSSIKVLSGVKAVHLTLDEESILTETSDGYVFMYYDNQYYLVAYYGEEVSLVLPSEINGKKYTINMGAFAYYYQLEEVVISDGITSIGDSAFYNCYNLKSVEISNSVTSIESYAFAGCGLTYIELPNSITKISSYTFYYCTNLLEVKLPSNLTTIDSYAFYSCTSLKSIIINENVTIIGNDIFKNNDIVIIYCETYTKPEGWNEKWNSSNRPVYWGDEWEYDSDENPVPLS